MKSEQGQRMPAGPSPAALAVCMLSDGSAGDTLRAIASVQAHNLPIHLGLTSGATAAFSGPGVSCHRMAWHGDFSEARNQLLAHVEARHVLWIDSDEVLSSFGLPGPELDRDYYHVFLRADTHSTPALTVRLHRNSGAIRWHGRVHESPGLPEQLSANRPGTLPSILIEHDGYELPAQRARKQERNRSLLPDVPVDELTYRELLTLARYESYRARGTPILWMKVVNHPEAAAGGWYNVPAEACEMLCSCGYAAPALRLLAHDPTLVRLHAAVLAARRVAGQPMDEDRLRAMIRPLREGSYSPYYAFPKAWLDLDEQNAHLAIEEMLMAWGSSVA